MRPLLCVCLLLPLMGCGKDSEKKTQTAARGTARSSSSLAEQPAPSKAGPPPEKKPSAGRARPRVTPALQREVDAFLKEPPLKVTAGDLVKAYQNEAVGDKEFKERKVWVTGYVLRTGIGTLGAAYVELEPGKDQSGAVRCFFEKGRSLPLEDVNEGQEVTLEGRVSAKTGRDIRLNDCRLRTPAEIQSILEAAGIE
jgi:tRNA_anti-like